MSWSSNLEPASPIFPSAVTQEIFTSKSAEPSFSASVGAAFDAFSPIAPRAAAAAQAGLRSVADTFPRTPAMAIMLEAVSSSVSARSPSKASIWESAIWPMAPREAAAATRTPTSLLPRCPPKSPTCDAALSPRPASSFMALMRTNTSESASSLQAVALYASALSLGIAPRAAARTRGWLLSSMPPRASISAFMDPRPMQAPMTTSTSDSFSFAATFSAADTAFMLPKAMHASTTTSRSLSPRHASTGSEYCEAASPKYPSAWMAAFLSSFSWAPLSFSAMESAKSAP
mmetsp:Transcript_19642/g.61716  ORF Transcript_19642/g.61716 Transcript_19642/m.61716 type:complete len:288 (-) Transcript_19642:256-1119(-)